LALTSDGRVVAWGYGLYGQCNVPTGNDFVAVAASSEYHSLALRSDGSLVAWGLNDYGQCNVPALPSGLTYVGMSGGSRHSLGLRSDGSIIGWGANNWGQGNVPPLAPGGRYISVEAEYVGGLALEVVPEPITALGFFMGASCLGGWFLRRRSG
jgi:alpha-tubulin suppressor-like RCC1 family protein